MERIIDAIWAKAPPRSVRNRVHAIISGLRRLLGRETILTRPSGYVLRLGGVGALDAAEFERIVAVGRTRAVAGDPGGAAEFFRSALNLWRGHVYEDVLSPQLAAEATRLNELRRRVFEDYAAIQLQRGEYAELITDLARTLSQDPLQERLRGQLMVAFYRSGRQAEALAVYEAGARVMAEEYGLDPGDELRRTRQAILLSDPSLDGPRAGTEHARPHHLPPALPDFAGRHSELDLLRRLLSSPPQHTGRVVILTGMGGVGKTALAIHATHAVQDQYADGCLYADLGGLDPAPVPPTAILQAFLRTLGCPTDKLPTGLPECTALFRSLTHGRRLLLLLDDAHCEQQVRPLLLGNASSVVVTSRLALTGIEAACLLPLGTLTLPESLDVMRAIAGRDRVDADPVSADAVTARCGRLPLALRIVATRLSAHPAMTMATMARRLRDQRGRLDELRTGDLDVRSRLALSWGQLDPVTAELLLLLSDAPEPHTASQAARLQASSVRDARARLEELDSAQLLRTADCERYEMHALIRLITFERLQAAREQTGFGPRHQREKKFHRTFTQAPSSLRSDPFGDPSHTGTPKRRVT